MDRVYKGEWAMANDLRAGRGRRGNGGSRNDAANTSRLDSLKKSRGEFDLAGLHIDVMVYTILTAVRAGGAIRVGLSRDKGALGVGVFLDGSSETVYLNKDDDQREFWLKIIQVYDEEVTEDELYGGK